jgi:nitroreductase
MKSAPEILELIQKRRSIKPILFNEQVVPREHVELLLEAATWAPTHGQTQPWSFTVFGPESKRDFAQDLVAFYKQKVGEKANEETQQRLVMMADKSSYIVAFGYNYKEGQAIPENEEIAAVACAMQNFHLMATSLNIVGFWSSPAFIYAPEAPLALKCDNIQKLMGVFYLGYTDAPIPEAKRIPFAEKTLWKN